MHVNIPIRIQFHGWSIPAVSIAIEQEAVGMTILMPMHIIDPGREWSYVHALKMKV
jgi:hypothetical protein